MGEGRGTGATCEVVGSGQHLATARVDVADDVTHVFLRHNDLDLHHRLHEAGLALLEPLPECCARGDLEREHRGVDVVVGAVDKLGLDANDRETSDDAVVHDRLEALGHARDVLLGDRATLDLRLEDESGLALGERLELDLDACELPGAARLLLVRVVDLRRLGDRLAVRHLRSAHLALHVELALHAVHDDLLEERARAREERGGSCRQLRGSTRMCSFCACSQGSESEACALTHTHTLQGLARSKAKASRARN
eukprot:3430978-Rhodomonas_salina.2